MPALPSAEITEGRAALLRVLTKTEATFVAARCRVTTAAVYNWTSGIRRPGAFARQALARSYGIEPEAWDRPLLRRRAG